MVWEFRVAEPACLLRDRIPEETGDSKETENRINLEFFCMSNGCKRWCWNGAISET